jgi:hypothetical protein
MLRGAEILVSQLCIATIEGAKEVRTMRTALQGRTDVAPAIESQIDDLLTVAPFANGERTPALEKRKRSSNTPGA